MKISKLRSKLHINSPRKLIGWGLILIGLIGIICAFSLWRQTPKPPKNVDTTSAPSTKRPAPTAVASYSVPPLNPKYIAIPAINVTRSRIVQLGVLKNGQIATPDNIYDTGWYNASSRPGQAGAMFIYGHVSSWTADGVFYNLKKLKAGDKVIITRGDNQTFTYQVAYSKVYPYNNVNMSQVLTPVNPKVPGLNLMTCTGQVIKGTSEFNERLVVFTSLMK